MPSAPIVLAFPRETRFPWRERSVQMSSNAPLTGTFRRANLKPSPVDCTNHGDHDGSGARCCYGGAGSSEFVINGRGKSSISVAKAGFPGGWPCWSIQLTDPLRILAVVSLLLPPDWLLRILHHGQLSSMVNIAGGVNRRDVFNAIGLRRRPKQGCVDDPYMSSPHQRWYLATKGLTSAASPHISTLRMARSSYIIVGTLAMWLAAHGSVLALQLVVLLRELSQQPAEMMPCHQPNTHHSPTVGHSGPGAVQSTATAVTTTALTLDSSNCDIILDDVLESDPRQQSRSMEPIAHFDGDQDQCIRYLVDFAVDALGDGNSGVNGLTAAMSYSDKVDMEVTQECCDSAAPPREHLSPDLFTSYADVGHGKDGGAHATQGIHGTECVLAVGHTAAVHKSSSCSHDDSDMDSRSPSNLPLPSSPSHIADYPLRYTHLTDRPATPSPVTPCRAPHTCRMHATGAYRGDVFEPNHTAMAGRADPNTFSLSSPAASGYPFLRQSLLCTPLSNPLQQGENPDGTVATFTAMPPSISSTVVWRRDGADEEILFSDDSDSDTERDDENVDLDALLVDRDPANWTSLRLRFGTVPLGNETSDEESDDEEVVSDNIAVDPSNWIPLRLRFSVVALHPAAGGCTTEKSPYSSAAAERGLPAGTNSGTSCVSPAASTATSHSTSAWTTPQRVVVPDTSVGPPPSTEAANGFADGAGAAYYPRRGCRSYYWPSARFSPCHVLAATRQQLSKAAPAPCPATILDHKPGIAAQRNPAGHVARMAAAFERRVAEHWQKSQPLLMRPSVASFGLR